MTERPLIFSAPMVRALRAGRKSMTRRVLKPLPGLTLDAVIRDGVRDEDSVRCTREQVRDPEFVVGDRIWVKETWRHGDPIYRADLGPDDASVWGWTSARFMPKALARIWLTVTDVRVERLQQIDEADAWAEGMPEPYLGDGDPPFQEMAVTVTRRMQFRNLWEELHGAGSWADDPFVAVIGFKVEKEQDG